MDIIDIHEYNLFTSSTEVSHIFLITQSYSYLPDEDTLTLYISPVTYFHLNFSPVYLISTAFPYDVDCISIWKQIAITQSACLFCLNAGGRCHKRLSKLPKGHKAMQELDKQQDSLNIQSSELPSASQTTVCVWIIGHLATSNILNSVDEGADIPDV